MLLPKMVVQKEDKCHSEMLSMEVQDSQAVARICQTQQKMG